MYLHHKPETAVRIAVALWDWKTLTWEEKGICREADWELQWKHNVGIFLCISVAVDQCGKSAEIFHYSIGSNGEASGLLKCDIIDPLTSKYMVVEAGPDESDLYINWWII